MFHGHWRGPLKQFAKNCPLKMEKPFAGNIDVHSYNIADGGIKTDFNIPKQRPMQALCNNIQAFAVR